MARMGKPVLNHSTASTPDPLPKVLPAAVVSFANLILGSGSLWLTATKQGCRIGCGRLVPMLLALASKECVAIDYVRNICGWRDNTP